MSGEVVDPPALLRALFDAAVDAVLPARCVAAHLPPPPRGRTIVIGAGKAAAAMAREVELHWPGELQGLVVTRYGHGVACERVEVVEAAHPIPDVAGQRAAARILQMVQGLDEDDQVLCLLSGGGSALLALPPESLTLEDKQKVHRQLLRSGASITEMNCVRKHLSAIKGGRLGVACWPARVLTLVISDVPRDDPAVIASGPTVPDPSTSEEALRILEQYEVAVPRAVLECIATHETPKPGDPRFERCEHRIIAKAAEALHAAAVVAHERGITPILLGEHIQGEARELGAKHGLRARRVASGAEPMPKPCVLISGGETSVTVHGSGRGGRNSEYGLGLVLSLMGQPGVWAIAADTDGIDGTEDNAGCVIHPETLNRGASHGLDARACLENNDSYGFFAGIGALVMTGPTCTNVNDFRAILVT